MVYIMNITGFARGSIAFVGILTLALMYMIGGFIPSSVLYMIVVIAAVITGVAVFKLVRQ
jgi:hypothetical protein